MIAIKKHQKLLEAVFSAKFKNDMLKAHHVTSDLILAYLEKIVNNVLLTSIKKYIIGGC